MNQSGTKEKITGQFPAFQIREMRRFSSGRRSHFGNIAKGLRQNSQNSGGDFQTWQIQVR